MDAHASVRGGTIQTQKDAVRHGCPSWARGGTVEANLVGFNGFDFLELLILVLGGYADFALSRGGEGSIVSQISGGHV